MSKLIAKITEIKNCKMLHIVKFNLSSHDLSMMSLELPNVNIGTQVELGVKPINIIIAKDFSQNISFSNRLEMVISDIDVGELLCSVELILGEIKLQSIMTKDVFDAMGLSVGDEVSVFIKASELFIKKICDV